MSEKEKSSFSDIYLSNKIDEKNWSRPVKLGTNINTGRDEFAPFIAPDNKTMYYSSNRKDMGIGGADIYKVTRKDDTWLNWTDPVNVGRPLNTRAFDSYMSIDASGMVFTAQSGRTIDGGNLDIFVLNERPIKIGLKGVVTDEKTDETIIATLLLKKDGNAIDTLNADTGDGTYETKLPDEGKYELEVSAEGYFPKSGKVILMNLVNDTTVFKDFALKPIKKNVILTGTIYDAKTNEPIESSIVANLRLNSDIGFKKATDKGYYESELVKTGWYILTASAEGYLNSTDSIESVGGEATLISKEFYLDPIEIGSTVRLNNIFFDFDKTTLKSESFIELDKVVDFLNNNGSVEIEIAGHTDSKGSDDYNLNLSQGRAQAVVDYLIQNGIDDFRL
ncbi:MAG: OmpA family protein, partial [Bacteroidota bacterium]